MKVLGAMLHTTEMHTPIAKIIRLTILLKTHFRDYVPPVALLVSYEKWDQLTIWPLKMLCIGDDRRKFTYQHLCDWDLNLVSNVGSPVCDNNV